MKNVALCLCVVSMPSDLVLEIVASACSGCTATLLGHPLDCIKVRLQAMQRPGMTTFSCAMDLLKTEGPPAFLRGVGAPLINAVIMNTVMFVAFEEARKRLPDTTVGSLLAGAISGLATSVLSTPTDWLKVQAQVRAAKVRDVLSDVLRAGPLHAPRKMFTGHTMNMLREGVFTAVYLGLYAQLRSAFVAEQQGGSVPLHLVAGASATTGALAWVAAYPFDSVKSVQQAQPALTASTVKPASLQRHSVAGAARSLWQQGGIGAFYRGLSASTARAMLVTTSRLFTYEAIKGWFA